MRALPPLSALALALAAGCGGSSPAPEPAREEAAAPAATERDDAPSEEEAASTVPRVTVTLWFPSSSGDALVGEESEIFSTPDPGARAKQIVSALIAGPSNAGAARALPADTMLRQVYVLEDGTAWIDFSSQLRTGIGGGSSDERLAVYCVVDSVALNVPEIGRVGILLDGNPIASLNGHLDLRRPLPPDRSLLSGAGVVGVDREGV